MWHAFRTATRDRVAAGGRRRRRRRLGPSDLRRARRLVHPRSRAERARLTPRDSYVPSGAVNSGVRPSSGARRPAARVVRAAQRRRRRSPRPDRPAGPPRPAPARPAGAPRPAPGPPARGGRPPEQARRPGRRRAAQLGPRSPVTPAVSPRRTSAAAAIPDRLRPDAVHPSSAPPRTNCPRQGGRKSRRTARSSVSDGQRPVCRAPPAPRPGGRAGRRRPHVGEGHRAQPALARSAPAARRTRWSPAGGWRGR